MSANNLWNAVVQGFNDYIKGIDPSNIIEKFFTVLLILIIMKIVLSFGNKIIDSIINTNSKLTKISRDGKIPIHIQFNEKRNNTLNAVSKSVLKYSIFTVGGLQILSNFMNIGSLLTVAGVGGITIAFGAQNSVEDIVTGFFILLEDQFSVGEYITTSSLGGIVEDIGLRTTKIRGFNGDLYIIHNRNISEVINHSRGNMRAMIDVGVAYEEDIQKCIDVLRRVCIEVAQENKQIVEGPEVLGVQELDESSVNIRIIAQTVSMEQWGVERMLRQRIKEAFDKENIEIPYPKVAIQKS